MKSKKFKKAVLALVMSIGILGSAVPVFAQTISFDITVPGDIKSKRAIKADSEQRFYVTGTSFNKDGTLGAISIRCDVTTIRSDYAFITPDRPASSAPYSMHAAAGVEYYMSTKATVNDFHVIGRYTP